MTESQLQEIEARCNAATPGPWKFKEYEYGYSGLEGGDGQYIFYPDGQNDGDRPITWLGEEMKEADRVMIEHAPTDIAALLAEVKRLREALEYYDGFDTRIITPARKALEG